MKHVSFLAFGLCCSLLGAGVVVVCAESARFVETRIPHRDASGRATIVEVDPSAPGAREFLHAEPEPIPRRGELILPPRSTPVPSPGVHGSGHDSGAPQASRKASSSLGRRAIGP